MNIPASSYTFPSNAQFRRQCDASGNSDYIYIDKVTITATSGGGAFAPNSIADLGSSSINGFIGASSEESFIELDGMQLSPNPASKQATLRVELDIEDENSVDVRMNIFNIQGRLVQSKNWDGINNDFFEKSIDVSQLSKGVYFVNITTSKGFIETQKLIVK